MLTATLLLLLAKGEKSYVNTWYEYLLEKSHDIEPVIVCIESDPQYTLLFSGKIVPNPSSVSDYFYLTVRTSGSSGCTIYIIF
jgi:hypothetical protein